ncbi:MAG TPA: DUF5916 domain-containing protein [Gemmatimonadaceae bacterium]
MPERAPTALRALLLLALAGGSAAAQQPALAASTPAGAEAPAVLRSARAPQPPRIDGRDDDPVWATAPLSDGFRVFDPVEDGAPPMRTTVRVVHDGKAIYAFVRAYDPHPDSIVGILSRRDVKTPSDQLKIMIDSYHDRRTAYEFAVNPVGVKRDYYLFDDSNEDGSWDAVWDVATQVDSLGWTAEFEIPLSQLRFPAGEEHTFGLMVMRDVGRSNVRMAWPLYRRSRAGVASQFGTLAGLRGLESPHRVELSPYALTRNVSVTRAGDFGRAQRQQFGADLKYGVTSNLTLDATINPDFGQVEADPAQLNLTAFEQFFQERRPFFLEGMGIFQFFGVRPFYSRRVGRAPQLAGLVRDADAEVPGATPIAGAAKLTGRLPTGTSVGTLAALTRAERVGNTLVEPRTLFGVGRVTQDLRKGESGVGVMLTALERDLSDSAAAARLRRDAVTGGVDMRHRWAEGRFQLRGSLQGTRVRGTAQAITRTQLSGVHFYQKPDDRLTVDSAATALTGAALSTQFLYRGKVLNVTSGYDAQSPGFEPNDAGFLSRADGQSSFAEVLFRSARPRYFWRNATATLFTSHSWTADGTSRDHMIDGWTELQFRNQQSFFIEYYYQGWGGAMCDRCAFGGPALRKSPSHTLILQLGDDERKKVAPDLTIVAARGDEGRSHTLRVNPEVELRPAGNITAEVGVSYEKNEDDAQFFGTESVDAAPAWLFAHLSQRTLSLTGRVDWTIRPTLSVQLYAEPFVSAGRYADVRALAEARAPRYADRFRPWGDDVGTGADFNVKQLRTNAVLRWEYRPGSTLFAVWSQGRDQDDRNPGVFAPRRDLGNLFRARPDNVFLVKASYWLSL